MMGVMKPELIANEIPDKTDLLYKPANEMNIKIIEKGNKQPT